MKCKLLTGLFVAASFFMLSGPLFAHHASTWADDDNPIEITGTVIAWNYFNPHVLMVVAAKDENGSIVDQWTVEFNNPQALNRGGLRSTAIKPGDEVTVGGGPAKNGSKRLHQHGVLVVNGKDLSNKGTD